MATARGVHADSGDATAEFHGCVSDISHGEALRN